MDGILVLASRQAIHETIDAYWARVKTCEELEAKLAEEVEEKLDAISTLDAWFDRRELAHDAVDQAVIDAASGYLRTSRVGGMPQKESDLVLAVIQDMARLSLFADLFARAACDPAAIAAKLKGDSDERA